MNRGFHLLAWSHPRRPLPRRTMSSGGNMAINWLKDVDAALTQANQTNRPLLLDFSAAPD